MYLKRSRQIKHLIEVHREHLEAKIQNNQSPITSRQHQNTGDSEPQLTKQSHGILEIKHEHWTTQNTREEKDWNLPERGSVLRAAIPILQKKKKKKKDQEKQQKQRRSINQQSTRGKHLRVEKLKPVKNSSTLQKLTLSSWQTHQPNQNPQISQFNYKP